MSYEIIVLLAFFFLLSIPVFGYQFRKGRREASIRSAAREYGYSEEEIEEMVRKWV